MAIWPMPTPPPPPGARAQTLSCGRLLRELPSLGGERAHHGGHTGCILAGGGAVTHSPGNTLQEGRASKEVIRKVGCKMGAKIEPGARPIGLDFSRARRNAERTEIA